MFDTPFTARNVAKFVAKSAVHYATAKQVETQIEDHTRFEKDDFLVQTTGHVIGWYVSEKCKPVTDKIVDKSADFITTKREAWKAKKDKKSE